jgi:hypothetical protein
MHGAAWVFVDLLAMTVASGVFFLAFLPAFLGVLPGPGVVLTHALIDP